MGGPAAVTTPQRVQADAVLARSRPAPAGKTNGTIGRSRSRKKRSPHRACGWQGAVADSPPHAVCPKPRRFARPCTIGWSPSMKYETSYTIDLLDPSVNSVYCVRPLWAFGLRHDDFTGSPTRWSFADS
jgi:hypothetical protein